MIINNVTQSISEIESNLTLYSESLDKIRYYFNELEKRKVFFHALDKDPNVDSFSDFRNQLNFLGFLTISILDLLVISKNILLSKYKWDRVQQIRAGYLIIHSVIETYNIHARHLKISSENNSKLSDLFNLITTQLKNFKRKHSYPYQFITIRNSTIGHITSDFKTYYDIIYKIDDAKCFEAILDFLLIIYKLQEFSNDNSYTLKLEFETNTILLKTNNEH